jgi:hypothetical protein
MCVCACCCQTGDADDNYAKVLGLSYLFYEAQQSGDLPSWNRLLYGTNAGVYGTGYRKSAHRTDGADVGKDLSGGLYDAGGERGKPRLCQVTQG